MHLSYIFITCRHSLFTPQKVAISEPVETGLGSARTIPRQQNYIITKDIKSFHQKVVHCQYFPLLSKVSTWIHPMWWAFPYLPPTSLLHSPVCVQRDFSKEQLLVPLNKHLPLPCMWQELEKLLGRARGGSILLHCKPMEQNAVSPRMDKPAERWELGGHSACACYA